MTILVVAPRDKSQQFMAWLPDQPGGYPMTGTGDTPEEALKDLREMIQNLIDGNYGDERDLIQAKELLPGLYGEDFQIFLEPGIEVNSPLSFDLDFDNYIFPEQYI